jgi:hypothetical protein
VPFARAGYAVADAARGRHGRWWLVAVWMAVVLVIARIALAPVLTAVINHELAHQGRYRGGISSLSLSLFLGRYTIDGLHLESFHPVGAHQSNGKASAQEGQWVPVLAIDELRCSIAWMPLLHGHFVGNLEVDHPVMTIEQDPAPGPQATAGAAAVGLAQSAGKTLPAAPPPAPGTRPGQADAPWQDRIRGLIRLRIDHFAMRDGELHFTPQTGGLAVAITGVDGTIDHLVVEPHGNQHAQFAFNGQSIGGGIIHADGTIDPLAKLPIFAVRASLTGVDLPAINPMTTNFDHLTFKKGVFSGFAELSCDGQHIAGYVKPIFRDLDIATFKDHGHGFAVREFWKLIIAAGQPLLRNHGADQDAAKIPISGQVGDPKANVWATIGSALRNAFIKALIPGFDSKG